MLLFFYGAHVASRGHGLGRVMFLFLVLLGPVHNEHNGPEHDARARYDDHDERAQVRLVELLWKKKDGGVFKYQITRVSYALGVKAMEVKE